jgi:hypothetical protein
MTTARSQPLIDALTGALTGSGPTAAASHLDDQTLLHIAGASGLAGDYVGREAICALLERMSATTGGTLRFEVLSATVGRVGHVRFCGTVSGGRGDRSLATAATLETTISDACIREIRLSCADEPAWDTFWG